jgi:transcriptional regulator with XRE-family HTH domain
MVMKVGDCMTFGERLVYARNKKGLNQKQFAELIGITPTRLNYWEKDKREPDVTMIWKIIKALEISGDWLIGNSNNFCDMKNSPAPAQAETGDLTPDKIELLHDYDQLNENGKEAARNSIHGLTSIPDYKKSFESKFFEKNA